MKELIFPFESKTILRKRRAIKKQLLADGSARIKKKIAVLGGSTTDDVVSAMELFLLNFGIEPEFYQSEYNKFYEDAVFGSPELDSFSPDIIYIHTTSRNLTMLPESPSESPEQIQERLDGQFEYFKQMWINLVKKFSCPIIQNNFELPLFRHSGNYDGWGYSGTGAFINRMNVMFSDYARNNNGFYINDINYLSSVIGLTKWHDPDAWFLYKYAVRAEVIPDLAYSVACIIKSVYGKNQKVIDLDLDNTLWGGVIGDDGQEGIEIGPETAVGQSFSEFQTFLKGYKNYGVLLAVCSKNDEENALLGLNHPSSVLRPDDFVSVKANWDNKDHNIEQSANEIGLLAESFVFVDDNPAECAIVEAQLPNVSVVNITSVSDAMYQLSRSGFFEITSLSKDDLHRSEMYAANARRTAQQKSFTNYTDYLLSLNMKAGITDFLPVYLQRITQLTNKSNQFNVTTRRYSGSEMAEVAKSPDHIRLCGQLSDKFGDNGVVSVVIGRCENTTLHIELWLMSCRVLKRDMELAMLDELVKKCRERGIDKIMGYYYRTPKNNMVSELFGSFGFTPESKNENGDSVWSLDITSYTNKNHVIKVNEKEFSHE
ncbi:MAG: HAD-IIIC family phosphatase [Ruminococcus sp.]|nr:HAD-IIIC family phosphatase [Ruminococcus sp.]MDE6849004.1 HAD-IIIC family phosphatase [Ruminococcus sp.]